MVINQLASDDQSVPSLVEGDQVASDQVGNIAKWQVTCKVVKGNDCIYISCLSFHTMQVFGISIYFSFIIV